MSSPHVLVLDGTHVDRHVVSMALMHHNVRGHKEPSHPYGKDRISELPNDLIHHIMSFLLSMKEAKSPKLAHLPVVIASSDNIPERIRKCLDGGAKDYILKPVKIVDRQWWPDDGIMIRGGGGWMRGGGWLGMDAMCGHPARKVCPRWD
uniref:Response regulatory domain-containing protein n=1 Tax=Oryza meridionalis TaxID=40149 RepID=A0A0E0EL20_9ORYZ